MDGKITEINEDGDMMTFTLATDVSIANAIRRTILSDIECVVFKTTPHSENKVDIHTNTTRMNNEILKQRLTCVPIHISDPDFPLDQFVVEVDVENTSDIIHFVTTKDFKVRDITTDKFVTEEQRDEIFPPSKITGDYIDVIRLRPKLSSDGSGERIHFTAKLSLGVARDDGGFNIVSCCAYGNTPAREVIHEKWKEHHAQLVEAGDDEDTIEFKKGDWYILNSQRHYLPNSFDFKIETVGQYPCREIVGLAVNVIKARLMKIRDDISVNASNLIRPTTKTLENGYDILLYNEGYTTGKSIEYMLNHKYFVSEKILEFCGFSKDHPHIDMSYITIGFVSGYVPGEISSYITKAIDELVSLFDNISAQIK
jgi:DNA-directed RNA polymerase subunit L